MLRALRPLHHRQLAVLVYALPASHREENNRPGAPCRRDRQYPESAKLDIILSRLCHSSHQGQCPAITTSSDEGQKPAPNILQAAGEHNLDYVNLAAISKLRVSCIRTPGRGGGRRAAPVRGHPGPGPSGGCALGQGQVQARTPASRFEGHLSLSASVLCEHPAALRSIRCWVVPCRDSSSSAGSVRRVPSLHSSVSLRLVYTRPLFLQAL